MADVRETQTREIVAQHLRLVGGVDDADAEDGEQPVQVDQLAGQRDGTGVDGLRGRDAGYLLQDKAGQTIVEWDDPASDARYG